MAQWCKMLGTYLVFTRTAHSPAHNYSKDPFLKNVLGTHVFTDAELRKCVWFHLTSANLRSYTLVALTGLLQLGRDIHLLVKCFFRVGTLVNAKSVYSHRDSATYSAFCHRLQAMASCRRRCRTGLASCFGIRLVNE